MSKFATVGALLAGGAAVGGLVVTLFGLEGALSADTGDEITEYLVQLKDGLPENGLELNSASAQRLELALDDLTTQIAQSSASDDGSLHFVPRTYQGLVEFTEGRPFDFMAPNGESHLLYFRAATSDGVHFNIDGIRRSIALGGHRMFEFGDQDCRFELVNTFPDENRAILRIACS